DGFGLDLLEICSNKADERLRLRQLRAQGRVLAQDQGRAGRVLRGDSDRLVDGDLLRGSAAPRHAGDELAELDRGRGIDVAQLGGAGGKRSEGGGARLDCDESAPDRGDLGAVRVEPDGADVSAGPEPGES